MPRKPSLVNEGFVHLLRKLIQAKANLQCNNYAEIQQLQHYIRKDTGEYLSIQTLNRFFGLIKNDFKPALATLNILARYLHYNSFRDFEQANKTSQLTDPVDSSSSELIKLILSNLEVDKVNEKGLLSVMRNIWLLLKKQPDLAEEVCLFMASSEHGRRYFYEQFVNMDALDNYYGEGLKSYLTQAKGREQHFFGYALLSLRYFLTLQHDLFNYYFNKLLEYPISEVNTFHPYLLGRYYACQVLNAILNNELLETYEEVADSFDQHRQAVQNDKGFPFAEYCFAEALIFAQEYGMAWKMLQQGQKRIENTSLIEDEYLAQYDLLQLYAGYFAGFISEQKASSMLEALQDRSFSLVTKDYCTFFLLRLANALDLKTFSKTSVMQWDSLVEKTGFVFFRHGLITTTDNVVLMEIKGKKIV